MNIDSIFPGLRDTKTTKSANTRGIISKALSGNNEAARTLESGQKITGEVLSNDGTKLTLKLPGNMVLNARMEQSVPAGIGEQVTFLVKSNDGGTVQLQPLMENLAGQGTAMKALQAAGLVANDKTMAMTMAMMEQGMSIGKNNLTAMYSKILSNPQASIQNLVQMTKMDIPVNSINVEQFENYKNFEGVIRDTFNDVLEMLPDSVNNVIETQGVEAGLKFVANLMEMVSGENAGADYSQVLSNEEVSSALATYENETNILETDNTLAVIQDNQSPTTINEGINNTLTQAAMNISSKIAEKITDSINNLFNNNQNSILSSASQSSFESVSIDELNQIKELLSGNDDIASENAIANENVLNDIASDSFMQDSVDNPITLQTGTKDLIYSFIENGDIETAKGLLNNSISDSDIIAAFKKLIADEFSSLQGNNTSKVFSNERFQSIFKDAFLKQSMLKPEEISKENVSKLFEKMVQNTKELLSALDSAVPKDAPVKASLENVRDNIQFMDNINNAYSFVQIPLKMNSAKSEGDLYVYTNKKGMAGNDGQSSAYLHLDMENLGVVNCYVKMNKGQKVTTNFYLEDEKSLDLIEEHLPELTKRLSDRGYMLTTSCEITERKKDMMDMIMEKEQGSVSLSHLAFDVRA